MTVLQMKIPFDLKAYLVEAARADEKQAFEFLKANGFTGLVRKKDIENRMTFGYKDFNARHLTQYLGAPKAGASAITWNVGKAGTLTVFPKRKIVALINKGGAGSQMPDIKPIDTHVPEEHDAPETPAPRTPKAPKVPVKKPAPPTPPQQPEKKLPPALDPNVPGAKDNDDAGVPHVAVPANLIKQYEWAQDDPQNTAFRLKFMKALWQHFNAAKFHGALQEPRFGLMKNMAAHKMRVRGRWWPLYHRLEMAPRIFNASPAFFFEIFLHEMCHQAVTQVDKMDNDPHERANKGHGRYWQAWMKKVGLNPSRFDPNDNSTYLNKEEREAHDKKLQKLEQDKAAVKLEPMHVSTRSAGQEVTVQWNNELLHGLTAGEGKKGALAFVDYKEPYGTGFKLVRPQNIFKYVGPQQPENVKLAAEEKVKKILAYYQQKKEMRQINRLIRQRDRYGF
ncbi:hypothetical protein [Burkholderia phage BCSR5]|nr:hypothetical protein [Burkholderia phage BCSR5]